MTCLDLHEALLDAVCRHDLPRVKQCLKDGADVLYVHPLEDEDGPIQPVTPLSMVVFKLADNRLRQEDFQAFKDITLWLLLHGADTHHAMALAERSYGPFDEAWFDESLTVAPLGLIARAHFDRLAAGRMSPSLARPMTHPLVTPERADHPLQGIAWMVAGVFFLSVMDALSKHAVSQLSIPVLIAARSAMVLVLLLPWVLRSGGWSALRTRRAGAHLLRGLLAVCSMLAFFESLRLLPLATVIAISFAAPLFMTLLSVPLLQERVGAHRWGALLAGFAGVSLIVGPQAMDGELGLGAGLALVAALFYAASMTCVRWLSPTESDLSMLVWQNLTMGLAGAVGLLFVPLQVTPGMWPVIALMAVLVLLGQRCTFRALRLAPVGVVAPFHYSELLWAACFGWVFWQEWPGAHVWWGALFVVGAGLYTLWRERMRTLPGV